jgi:hypothetical protein
MAKKYHIWGLALISHPCNDSQNYNIYPNS